MTIAYKATHNYKCLVQTYEIGQEYKLDRKPILCSRGFHYCKNASFTLLYYTVYNKDFKLLEIEDLNPTETKIDIINGKYCSNHIRIIREITDQEEQKQLTGRSWFYNKETKIHTVFKYVNNNYLEFIYDDNGDFISYGKHGKIIQNS